MEEDPSPESFIPLELATALLNLRRLDDARGLLEPFLERHPDVLPGYQVLCEVFWEMGAFDRAEALLASCAEELKASGAHVLLRGETLSQAGRHSEAVALYASFIETYGPHNDILKALAGSYETLGDFVKARDLYMDLMNQCQSCHTAVDPLVHRKLTDIRFHLGEHKTTVLESYLALARADPLNRALYFDRISCIYTTLGNETEARRFAQFARQAGEAKE